MTPMRPLRNKESEIGVRLVFSTDNYLLLLRGTAALALSIHNDYNTCNAFTFVNCKCVLVEGNILYNIITHVDYYIIILMILYTRY